MFLHYLLLGGPNFFEEVSGGEGEPFEFKELVNSEMDMIQSDMVAQIYYRII